MYERERTYSLRWQQTVMESTLAAHLGNKDSIEKAKHLAGTQLSSQAPDVKFPPRATGAHECVIAIRDKREFKGGDHAACDLIHREEPGRPSLQFYFIVILISCCGRRGRGQGHPLALVRSLVRQSTKTENEGRELDTQGRAIATTGEERGPRREDTRDTKTAFPVRHRLRRSHRTSLRSTGSSQDGNGVSVRSQVSRPRRGRRSSVRLPETSPARQRYR